MEKILLIVVFCLTLVGSSFAAGTASDNDQKTNYDKGASLIKKAKKLEKKGKIEKAKKRYEKALKYLIKSNKAKPNQPDTLNYLGFATRKLGDYKKGEEYYLLGLQIDPNHKGINEYLGELYVVTNRIDLAKERLSVLKNCKCEEYEELKEIIEGKKQSKY
jgi:tetratricopeptide (TPR) repeat protein